jgi:hypothetical protein
MHPNYHQKDNYPQAQYIRHSYTPRDDYYSDFEMPERPGYYAGNRKFRMDKIRDQPLEKYDINPIHKRS